MKAAGANLVNLLASVSVYAMADLYTFTLSDGSNLRYTSAARDIGSFSALGPLLSRGSIRTTIGVEVASLSVTLNINETLNIGGVPAAQFARNGGFDGATLSVDRMMAASWNVSPAGNLPMFSGRVADVEITGTSINMDVKSDLELLDIQLPRNIYQAPCTHTVYDDGCGILKASFTDTGNTANGSTRSVILCNLTSHAAGYYELGPVTYTTGANANITRTCRVSASGNLTVAPPFPYVPAAGDHFTATAGCDNSLAVCSGTFNNTANIRAFPFIPAPETGV